MCAVVTVCVNARVSVSVFLHSDCVHKGVTHLGWLCHEKKSPAVSA